MIAFVFGWLACLCYSIQGAPLPFVQPDSMEDYKRIRKDYCEWKFERFVPISQDANQELNITRCEVEVRMPQGEGYLRYYRAGICKTHGGQELCTGYFNKSPNRPGSVTLSAIGAPLDPYTEEFISFPPIHLHHTGSFPMMIPNEEMKGSLMLLNSIYGYPVSTADMACFPEDGDNDCILTTMPEGMAKKNFEGLDFMGNFVLEDLRGPDSSPLSYYLEVGEFVLVKPYPAAPKLKDTYYSVLNSHGAFGFYTFSLPINQYSYNFKSYFVGAKCNIHILSTHAHWAEGDEIWLIKGTQEDIGIPLEHRKAVVHNWTEDHPFKNRVTAIPLSSKDEFYNFKMSFHNNINMNFAAYNVSKEKFSKNRVPPLLKYENHAKFPIGAPEIMNKYFGHVFVPTADYVEQQRKRTFDAFKPIIESGIHVPGAVSAAQQRDSLWANITLKDYYRRAKSQRKLKGNSKNGYFTVSLEPGEVFTLLAFNAARSAAAFQHTTLLTVVELPELDAVSSNGQNVEFQLIPKHQRSRKLIRGS